MGKYENAGVNQGLAGRLAGRIKTMADEVDSPRVVGGIGGFAGFYDIADMGYEEPVIAGATDSVGTKLEIAFALDDHHSVGIDLVAMSVNDLVCHGVRPLFFLDYIGVGVLDEDQAVEVIGGVIEGCREAGCALIGGETAQLPGFYPPGRYELVGFAVGIAEKSKIIDGSRIAPGDVAFGIPSNGFHSNGFSLINKIIAENGIDLGDRWGNKTVGETLLTPTRVYVAGVLELLDGVADVHGIAHITGGGLRENIGRLLPTGTYVRIDRSSWEPQPIFAQLAEWGDISDEDMFSTYNMGVGMVLIIPPAELEAARGIWPDGKVIGRVEAYDGDEPGWRVEIS
jgi:phosphoribosylformylglycinamidine cyclo-ligase